MESEPLNKNLLVICGTVIVVCAIIAGAVLYNNNHKASNTVAAGNNNNGQPAAQAVDIKNVKIAGEPFVGNDNAPVVIALWTDYQCPFCKKTDQDVVSKIYTDYVKTGKAKIVFKDYVFLGPDSVTAALAGRAVWEVAPDKFFTWSTAMFNKQDTENGGWGSKADILALTRSLGIDSTKVGQLMDSKAQQYQAAIDADKAEGLGFGIQGTPGTIIGTTFINGAQDYSQFKSAIDQVLAGK
ncbi:MAG: DsbA family protein [Candidatus Paceibacterales bacterium]